MAFNNWEKLSKAQRDYPKPRFAWAVVEKALKKNPSNPFLCAWKADLALRMNQTPRFVIDVLQQTCKLPGLTDTRLLSYLYELCAETTRKLSVPRTISSIGTEFLKPWQNAAKTFDRKDDRLGFWDALFKAAMREDCWEDVRFAVVSYNREGAPSKKLAHYTHILVVQLAAEQTKNVLNYNAQMSQIQFGVAHKLMKQAYNAFPDDPIAVKDIRDLRFMADIFERQGRAAELFSLWDDPPVPLKRLMRTHKDDLASIKTRVSCQQKDWPLLESHCYACIDETLLQLNTVEDSQCLWELCAWRSDLWINLIRATEAIHDEEEGANKISAVMDRCFGAGFKAKDRPLRLTYMKLRSFTGASMLSDCKEYWEHHHDLSSCFADLRPYVEVLCHGDDEDFFKFIFNQSMDMLSESDPNEAAFVRWQQANLNLMKFHYLLAVSLPELHSYDAMELLMTQLTQFHLICPKISDTGFLAIYTLLRLHHQIICGEKGSMPFEITPNSRVLLQAAMLARHLVAQDKDKENQTMSLLAARLHLNLGLGKCAFQLYRHTKFKEMLVDTLSPYILSRISFTHPFEVKGYQGFSADEELAKVISTIERMEKKTDSYLYTDMQSFVWDQAVDLLELKRKLRASSTKQICITERRRIARLTGESTENLPNIFDKGIIISSDNVDRTVFPNFEDTTSLGPLPFIMPNEILNGKQLGDSFSEYEASSVVLYRENGIQDPETWQGRGILLPGDPSWAVGNSAEAHLKRLWGYINLFTVELLFKAKVDLKYKERGEELLEGVRSIRKAMEKLRMPGGTTLKPEDEPAMFHENMLMSCYTKLEALRVLNKLTDQLREKVLHAKSGHAMRTKLSTEWVDKLASETKICYEAIRDVAQSYVDLIKKTGLAAIKAQVRWGKTGSLLRLIINDDDLNYYASEYVDSALEGWNGVLKVKLK